ncbi:alpha/beta fold hydrolase [Actinokineospora bangkokensis]|uniref:Alpha/beta hydrolase n=1 Tax=Actinokineospora bangkokensis TaxID=1193682 RepID=A0A1Q9LNW4_9PSEU|nr:alpha/beta hydrolase [Actinokineospora bangkokensis]OLR93708.1 alpha/beta hydrolase [Actinokineospora bangkokensis]
MHNTTGTDVIRRNNVTSAGGGDGPVLLFSHGFGCDSNTWRSVAPRFTDDHRVVLFDHVGAGGSDLGAWSPRRYADLGGYARDVVELCEALDLRDVVFVGHSVSAVIGVLAAARVPDRFAGLVLVGPSPRYLNDGDYVGGFTEADVEELLEAVESNYLGWSATMAPAIMGVPDRPDLGADLTASFCRTDPQIARHFARVTFTADNRADLPSVAHPTLILQCRQDIIAPVVVGEYVRDAIPGSELELLDATGHCPHLSAPEETAAALRGFLDRLAAARGR